jgi:hypothetical protein
MVKQSRIQLAAVKRYSANKAGELTSKTTLAVMLGNVAFIQEVVVFIIPSNSELLSSSCWVLTSNDG